MTVATRLSQDCTAIPDPDPARVRKAAALVPHNPFYSPAYVEARREMGDRPWLLNLAGDSQPVSCPAFLRTGRLSRSLEIPSWPDFEADEAARFWRWVLEVCRQRGVTELAVNSFASGRARIPVWPGERLRRKRCEHVLDLESSETDLWHRLSSNHARNIKRARKNGLTVQRTSEAGACQIHVELMAASLDRRRERGETVLDQDALRPVMALTKHGAGTLFQILHHDRVVSSILVLVAEKGAYYHSAGTSPDGMTSGASHCLIHEIALALQAQGIERFNLGGADESNGGLERFKTGFGTRVIELEAAEFSFAGPIRRGIRRVAGMLMAMRSA